MTGPVAICVRSSVRGLSKRPKWRLEVAFGDLGQPDAMPPLRAFASGDGHTIAAKFRHSPGSGPDFGGSPGFLSNVAFELRSSPPGGAFGRNAPDEGGVTSLGLIVSRPRYS